MAIILNKNLARWVFASLSVYFKSITDSLNLPLLVEGVDEREPEKMQEDHVELRVNGPFVKEVSHGCWRTWIDINLLLVNRMMMSTKNAYDIVQWGGVFEQAMAERIPVYKYGSNPEDTGTLLGCLTGRKGSSESVRLIHFGQVNKVDRIRQAIIDARYEMFLEM